jgi:hypothetical protein
MLHVNQASGGRQIKTPVNRDTSESKNTLAAGTFSSFSLPLYEIRDTTVAYNVYRT